ncbi:thioredoxin domain-containing protein [Angustibacter sp. McL0619]|uniref:thioredoxin domain-containing protein n=1 Tax=Angustibacter sp. McL0619 TaxID=3415676 RepID=UPI003CE96FEB
MNRLASATSPYLLQHKDNPVDWQEWGPEAFEEARRRDVPILLSVGYASCHWCHVMAHESFEDEQTAAELNAAFVSIKVDREERPDVDAVYMEATVALTGHGGWPMTVLLTPDGTVFHAGTYYPPTARQGMASFRQLIAAASEAWRERRHEVEGASARITEALTGQRAGQASASADAAPPGPADLEGWVRALAEQHDRVHGGFGGAPKFPPSMVLEWLLRHAARTGTQPGASGAIALDLAANTLRHMASSGTYDQLEGGFARYSVDAAWVVPHFEKMLYDNALLARVYLHWWRLTGDPLGRRIALETCDFLLHRLGTAEGGLASALDADTPTGDGGHGVEGLTYVWTPAELVEVLGQDDGVWAARAFGVTEAGTFEHGTSTLRLLVDVDAPDADPATVQRWQDVRARLRSPRAGRPQPVRDDKVVAAWNGLAVASLAETGALLDRPDLVEAARRAASLLLDVHVVDGRLRRVSLGGVAGDPSGTLEDQGDLVEGLLALYAVTGERRWSDASSELVAALLERFWDVGTGLSDTPLDDPDPLLAHAGTRRPADPGDNAYPSGVAAAAGALLSWAALSGDATARDVAESALAVTARIAATSPRFAGWGLAVAEAALDGPREVAVVGGWDDSATSQLWQVALNGTAPGLVVAVGESGAPPAVPLLEQRGTAGTGALAYPCRGMVCDLPTSDPEVLRRFVRRPG